MSFQAGHIPSWHESCELYALSPVAAVSRWLLPYSRATVSRGPKGVCETIRA